MTRTRKLFSAAALIAVAFLGTTACADTTAPELTHNRLVETPTITEVQEFPQRGAPKQTDRIEE